MNFIQYIKQAWKAGASGGTPLSPDRLNHMEDGIKNNNSMISELNSNNITNNICTNLLKPTLQTTTKNGVTCTNNNDGTYTFIGTATAETEFTFSTIKLKYGKYKLLDALGYQRTSNNAWVKTLHDGDIFEVDADKPILQIHMHFAQGTTANNLNKKPMITTNLNATHDDFVSYTGNTGRLNADVALLRNNLDNTINKYVINTKETIYIPLNTMLLIYETAFDMGTYVVRSEPGNKMFIHALKENSKVNIELADNGNIKITNTASVGGDILTIVY